MNPTPFWQGTNFYLALLTMAATAFGIVGDLPQQIVAAGVGFISLIQAVRQYATTAHFVGWGAFVSSGNTWTGLAGVLTAFLPALGTLVPSLHDLAAAIIQKNFGAILTALFALGVSIYHIVTKPASPDTKFKKKPGK